MTKKAVLFIGTFSPPVTGQSAAFELIYDRYDGEKYKINKWPYLAGVLGKILTHLKVGVLTLYYLLFKKVDVIYATTFSSLAGSASDIILFTINKFFRKKVIIHSHGSQYRNIIENSFSPLRQILTYLLKDIDTAVVLFDGMKSQFNWLIPETNIFVIPNCYDPVLDSVKVFKRYQAGPLRIGYISNLMYVKGIVHLIDAVKILREKGLNVTLNIAGQYLDDYQMSAEELRALTEARLKDIDYIKYLGPVK